MARILSQHDSTTKGTPGQGKLRPTRDKGTFSGKKDSVKRLHVNDPQSGIFNPKGGDKIATIAGNDLVGGVNPTIIGANEGSKGGSNRKGTSLGTDGRKKIPSRGANKSLKTR